MHSNLGRALQDVCKQFIDHPPTFVQYNSHVPITRYSFSGTTSVNNVKLSPIRQYLNVMPCFTPDGLI